jgi:N-acetyl-gamma-glutamyl-phosphate reductase
MEQELSFAAGQAVVIQFTPHLIPVSRGILSTLYLRPTSNDATAINDAVSASYRKAYAHEPFVRILQGGALPDTKNVVGSNVLELAWRHDPRTGRLIVMSALDNIVKGASGQAVQSLNIAAGFDETAALM